ncbi:glycosyltransferase [Bacillus sp. NP157]|nr:glycosyltransferase [Bacillus sp. NP157]
MAELLRSNIPLLRGLGVDARWIVFAGSDAFFRVVKRLYHAAYGLPGDGSPLGEAQLMLFGETAIAGMPELGARVRRGDVVILHDPQSLGFAPLLRRLGVHVVWRMHLGTAATNEFTNEARFFLEHWTGALDAAIFLHRDYVGAWGLHCPASAVAPSIDPWSPKNRPLGAETAQKLLGSLGLAPGSARGELTRSSHRNTSCRPYILQVGRWDEAKQPMQLVDEYLALCQTAGCDDLTLVLAGPSPDAVADDIEGRGVLDRVKATLNALPDRFRTRIRAMDLSMADSEANARMVNVLQANARVVVQNSSAEGFGLTITEAMWKSRPVVVRNVGGLAHQVEDGVNGRVVDACQPGAIAGAVSEVLWSPQVAHRLGRQARERVKHSYLQGTHMARFFRALCAGLQGEDPVCAEDSEGFRDIPG